MPRINAGPAPRDRATIISGDKPKAPAKLSFSFQYWSQARFFALTNIAMDWVVEFFARLKELCGFTRDEWDTEVLGNRRSGGRWHYHPVIWDATNIPIKKDEIDWVPKAILQNEDEYPFYQIGLGAGGGRFAGFWETPDRFAIVLLDPLHNLYPAKQLNYKVTDCLVHPSSAELMHLAIDQVRRDLPCAVDACPVHAGLAKITLEKNVDGAHYFNEVLPVGADVDDRRMLHELLAAGKVKSVSEILKRGLTSYSDELLEEMIAADKAAPDAEQR